MESDHLPLIISQINGRIDNLEDKMEFVRKGVHDCRELLNGTNFLTTGHSEQISKCIDLIQDNKRRLDEMEKKEILRELRLQTRREIFSPILDFFKNKGVLISLVSALGIYEADSIFNSLAKLLKAVLSFF